MTSVTRVAPPVPLDFSFSQASCCPSIMSNSTGASAGAPASIDPASLLPPYLNLPPHLSAHKYFFVCTLTVAAWDTLVLSPRTYRLFRTKEWPLLKWAFFFIRVLMPIEFIIVGMFLNCFIVFLRRIDWCPFGLQGSPFLISIGPEKCANISSYSNLS